MLVEFQWIFEMNFKINLNIIIVLATLLFSCKREEILTMPYEKKSLNGVWFSTAIKLKDVLNGKDNVQLTVKESYFPNSFSEYNNLPSQIKFSDDGSYTSVTHDDLLNFAFAGDVKRNSSGGTWIITSSKQIHFDKGYYEFNEQTPRILKIIKLSSDSLILQTEDPYFIHDWALQYGQMEAFKQDLSGFYNVCSHPYGKFVGLEFARKYATFIAFSEISKNYKITINPFGIGYRKGCVKTFDSKYSDFQKLAPIADSCYQQNFQTFYQEGKAQAKAQNEFVKTRSQSVTFYFSRISPL